MQIIFVRQPSLNSPLGSKKSLQIVMSEEERSSTGHMWLQLSTEKLYLPSDSEHEVYHHSHRWLLLRCMVGRYQAIELSEQLQPVGLKSIKI